MRPTRSVYSRTRRADGSWRWPSEHPGLLERNFFAFIGLISSGLLSVLVFATFTAQVLGAGDGDSAGITLAIIGGHVAFPVVIMVLHFVWPGLMISHLERWWDNMLGRS